VSAEQHIVIAPLELPLKPLTLRLGWLDEVLDASFINQSEASENSDKDRYLGIATNSKQWYIFDSKQKSWLIDSSKQVCPLKPRNPGFAFLGDRRVGYCDRLGYHRLPIIRTMFFQLPLDMALWQLAQKTESLRSGRPLSLGHPHGSLRASPRLARIFLQLEALLGVADPIRSL
jgi:hypothetical protein